MKRLAPYTDCDVSNGMASQLLDWANVPFIRRDELPGEDTMTPFLCRRYHVPSGYENPKICNKKSCANKFISMLIDFFEDRDDAFTAYDWMSSFVFEPIEPLEPLRRFTT
jgi:hypothetical protein